MPTPKSGSALLPEHVRAAATLNRICDALLRDPTNPTRQEEFRPHWEDLPNSWPIEQLILWETCCQTRLEHSQLGQVPAGHEFQLVPWGALGQLAQLGQLGQMGQLGQKRANLPEFQRAAWEL